MSTVRTREPIVLTPEMAGARMTPAEFDAVEDAEEGYVYELIHGELVVSPPVAETERGPNEYLGHLLLLYRQLHPQGAVLDWTLPENYVKTPDSRRRADRAIWVGLGRLPKPRRDPPTIAVEFVSAGKRSFQRDYVEKRDEYMATRMVEYWLFDRFRRVLTVLRRTRAGIGESVVKEGEVYTTPLLPGFELPVAQILAVADMFESATRPTPSPRKARKPKRKR